MLTYSMCGIMLIGSAFASDQLKCSVMMKSLQR